MDNPVKEEIEEYIDEEGNKVILKKIYIVVEDEKWKSQKNYYEKNKNEINTNLAENRKKKYNEDAEYREKIKAQQREYNARRREKQKKEINETNEKN